MHFYTPIAFLVHFLVRTTQPNPWQARLNHYWGKPHRANYIAPPSSIRGAHKMAYDPGLRQVHFIVLFNNSILFKNIFHFDPPVEPSYFYDLCRHSSLDGLFIAGGLFWTKQIKNLWTCKTSFFSLSLTRYLLISSKIRRPASRLLILFKTPSKHTNIYGNVCN